MTRFDRVAKGRGRSRTGMLRARAIATALVEASDWDCFYSICRALNSFCGVNTSNPDWGPPFADIGDGFEDFQRVQIEAREWLTTQPGLSLDDTAHELIQCFWLYRGYKVDSRGPGGCIMRALAMLHPEAHAMIADGEDEGEVLRRFWPGDHAEEFTVRT